MSRKTIGSSSGASSPSWSSMLSRTARRNRHSTEGWIDVHFSLMTAWTRASSSSRLRRTAIEKSGSTSRSLIRLTGPRSPGFVEVSSSVPIALSW